MKHLAWSSPQSDSPEYERTLASLMKCRSGGGTLQLTIGVGGVGSSPIPLRALGYAVEISTVVKYLDDTASPGILQLFGSGAKKAGLDQSPKRLISDAIEQDRLRLRALSFLLVQAGISQSRIDTRISSPNVEVAETISKAITLPEQLSNYLVGCGERHGGPNPLSYGVEHASPSMFQDLSCPDQPQRDLYISIGGAAEARFLAVRAAVREVALLKGYETNNSLGVVVPSLKRPWYHPLPGEPTLPEILKLEGVPQLKSRLRDVSRKFHQVKKELSRVERFFGSDKVLSDFQRETRKFYEKQ